MTVSPPSSHPSGPPPIQPPTIATVRHHLPPTPAKMGHILPAMGSLKKMLPLAAFLMAFATVMTPLLIYMDNTAARHHQFRLNMSKDDELLGISQDNPELITYIREVHLIAGSEHHHRPLESVNDRAAEDVAYILRVLNNKKEGTFVESGAYSDGKTSKTEYLEKQFSWTGLLIQSDPTHFFKLRRHNRNRSKAVHACLSSTPYPKEITYHQEDVDGVKINSIHPNNAVDDPDWFNTRVKCFPIYSLMLAMNLTAVDLMVVEAAGTELQVLETVPFERVRIDMIDVQLLTSEVESETIKKFLGTKNYIFMQRFGSSYVFRLNHVKI